MALYGDPSFDSRVQREASSLSEAGYRVSIACLNVDHPGALNVPDEVRVLSHRPASSDVLPGSRSPFHPDDPGTKVPSHGGRIAWLAGYMRNVRSWGRWATESIRADVWHAHDLTGLAALGRTSAFRRGPVIYDSHELYLESGSALRLPAPGRWLLRRYEGHLARRCAAVITVNAGVKEVLSHRYGVEPVVVMNCPPFVEVSRPGKLRSRLDLGDRPILLYHGALSPGRGIGTTIEALRLLPEDVAFVVLGDGSLGPALRVLAAGELAGRLVLHQQVPPRELLEWVVDADLAIMLIESTELNFRLSTPNKLFEAMTSGVPVLASALPVMQDIVESEGIGQVVDHADPPAIAGKIRSMLGSPETRHDMSLRARSAARETYNWEHQAESLLAVYRRVLGTSALKV